MSEPRPRHPPPGGRRRRLVSVLVSAALAALGEAHPAAGAAVLAKPPEVGVFPAVTYDTEGRPIGRAELALEGPRDGRFFLRMETSVEGGGRMRASAELEPTAAGLRLLRQESYAVSGSGTEYPLLNVDHVHGVATCTPPPGSSERFRRIDLDEDERIVNVPLNLFFLPLVRGEVEELEFQIFLCSRGARVVDFTARSRRIEGEGGAPVVEVRYRPDLGPFSWLAQPLVPELLFFFDAGGSDRYLAHRMPLHRDGPDVLVAREGVSPASLGTLR